MAKSSWQKIKEYYNYSCAYCGKIAILTQDHMTPKSKGGESIPENIAPACEECNQRKENKPIWVALTW